jgi:BRCT domain type II-containing protein
MAKPVTQTISTASRAAIAMVTVLDGWRARRATPRPAARKAAWPMTMVVLSTTTEASPSASGSRSRTR